MSDLVEAKITLLFRSDDDPDIIIDKLRRLAAANNMHCSRWHVHIMPEEVKVPKRRARKVKSHGTTQPLKHR